MRDTIRNPDFWGCVFFSGFQFSSEEYDCRPPIIKPCPAGIWLMGTSLGLQMDSLVKVTKSGATLTDRKSAFVVLGVGSRLDGLGGMRAKYRDGMKEGPSFDLEGSLLGISLREISRSFLQLEEPQFS